jgi:hypothetical protein
MAKLAGSYAKKEQIPAGASDFYIEQEDGTFALDTDIVVEDVAGLKSALKKERQTVKDLNKKLNAFGDLSVEELEELREKAEAVNDSEEVKKLTKDINKITKERDAAQARADKLWKKLEVVTLKADAATAISDADGEPDVLLPHVLGRATLTEEDDELVTVVRDEAGEPLMKGGKAGTLADVVAELKAKPKFAGAFGGTGASGSGARATTTGGGAPPAGGTKAVAEEQKTAKRRTSEAYSL